MKSYGTTAVAVFVTLAAAACTAPSPDKSKMIATVNGETITEKDYDNFRQLRHQRQGAIPDKEQERKIVLDELVERILLAQHARSAKLDQELDVHLLLKRARENILAQATIQDLFKDKPVTDEEMRSRFQSELTKAHKQEYRVRHVLVRDEQDAKDIIKRLSAGGNFAAIAKQRSIDTQTAKNGGELGDWITEGALVPEFFNAVTGLKKGEIHKTPIKTQYGFHVIKLDDVRERKFDSYEQFVADPQRRAQLTRVVQENRINGLLKELREKAKISTE